MVSGVILDLLLSSSVLCFMLSMVVRFCMLLSLCMLKVSLLFFDMMIVLFWLISMSLLFVSCVVLKYDIGMWLLMCV